MIVASPGQEEGSRPGGERRRGPFEPGSLSLGIYAHDSAGRRGTSVVDDLLSLAAVAEQAGFDGLTVSEHHRGRDGYVPNPMQVAGWYLDVTADMWAGPCPMVLPLRPVAIVAEEAAWLAARYPGRVGLVVAAGADREDFDAVGVDFEGRVPGFGADLARLVRSLSGGPDPLDGDQALAGCAERPIPVASGSFTRTGVRRAARCGAGVAFGRSMWSASAVGGADPLRTLLGAYEEAGGTGPRIFTSQVFLGAPPDGLDEGLNRRDSLGPAPSKLRATVGKRRTVGGTATDVVEDLLDALDVGMDCWNVRVPYHAVSVAQAQEQILQMGEEVLPDVRSGYVSRHPRPGVRQS